MAISTKHKSILNALGDYLPSFRKGQIGRADGGDIKLGDLIAGAESVAASEIALANGKILVGNGSGLAAAVTPSGEATTTNLGVFTLSNAAVIGKVLTGFVSGAGVVAATDTILAAFNKVVGNIAAKVSKTTGIAALGVTADLVGVNGTGSNAAPLVGTESRLDAIEAKVDAIIAALNA